MVDKQIPFYWTHICSHVSIIIILHRPAIHRHRRRCSHSHIIDTGAVTVTLPSCLPCGVLIVLLAIADHWHRSFFISASSCLVVVLSTGPLVSASYYVSFIQLIVMLSVVASSSASHHASASHGIPLVLVPPPPPPLVASLLFLGLRLLLCLCLSLSLSFGWLSCCCPLAPQLCSLYSHHSYFA
jgi:hypothetical protein